MYFTSACIHFTHSLLLYVYACHIAIVCILCQRVTTVLPPELSELLFVHQLERTYNTSRVYSTNFGFYISVLFLRAFSQFWSYSIPLLHSKAVSIHSVNTFQIYFLLHGITISLLSLLSKLSYNYIFSCSSY
jgi:hypothetical protein